MGGGSGGGGTQTSVTQNYSPEEAAFRSRLLGEGEGIYNAIKGLVWGSPYPGSQVVGFTPEQLKGQQMALNYAGGDAQKLFGSTRDALQFGLKDVLYADSNPYLKSAITAAQRPILQQWNDPGGIYSGIRTTSMGAGGQGTSTRQGIAEGIAASRGLDTMADISTKMSMDNYLRGLQTMERSMALAPTVQQMGMFPASIYDAVGSQRRQLQQGMEDYNASSRAWELEKYWGPLQNWANLLYGAGSSQSTAMSQLGNNSRSGPGLGGLLGAGAMATVNPMLGIAALLSLFG